ncbi:Hypothetical predicted protein, partial [Podarcis lilfordi]
MPLMAALASRAEKFSKNEKASHKSLDVKKKMFLLWINYNSADSFEALSPLRLITLLQMSVARPGKMPPEMWCQALPYVIPGLVLAGFNQP